MLHLVWLAYANYRDQKNLRRHPSEQRDEICFPSRGRAREGTDLQHPGKFRQRPLQARGGDVWIDDASAAPRSRREAHEIAGEADHRVAPDRRSRFGPEYASAVGEKGHRLRVLVDEREDRADVPLQFGVEAIRRLDGGTARGPETLVTGLEQMQRQFVLARKVFVQGRVRVAALPGDIPNARACKPVLAEQLHRGAKNVPLGRGIVVSDIE